MPSRSRRTIEFLLTAKDKTAKAFRSAQTGMSRLSASAASFAKSAGVGLGLFAGASGASAVAAIRSQVDELDRMGKASEALGIAVEELSKLRHGAELTGSSLTAMVNALEKMLNRVSKAAEGTGEAKDAIVEIGLDAAELEKLSPDEMFKELATAIAAVATTADKVRLKRAIFGRGDSNFINLINQGRAGIEGMADDLEQLDGVITQADTNAAAELSDSMLRMSANIDALARSVGAPAIKGINTLFEIFGQDAGISAISTDIAVLRTEIERTQRLLSDGGEGFLEGFAAIFTPDSVLKERIQRYRDELNRLLAIRDDYNNKAAEQESNQAILRAAGEHNKKLDGIRKAGLEKLQSSLKARESEFQRHADALARARDKQKELMQSIADANSEFEDFGKEIPAPDRFDIVDATGAAWDQINAGDTAGARAAIQTLIDMFRAYQEAGKASLADVTTLTAQLEALGQATNEASGTDLEKRAVQAAAAAQDLKDEIENKPIGAKIEAAQGSGKIVRDQTQEQISTEDPVEVRVTLGLAWGADVPGAMTQGDVNGGASVETESIKRGFRI